MASQLSPRQREILDLVAEGRTSKEIAVTLGISESTVNWHLANAFERLGASSRAEAVALAIRSNGAAPPAAPAPEPVPQVAQPSMPTAWPRLVAIAIAIALAGALLGGATVARFHIGQAPVPTAAPPTRLDTATSSPDGTAGRENPVEETASPDNDMGATADATRTPQPNGAPSVAPVPALSAPPVPALPLTPVPTPPTLPVTPPALPSPSLPPASLPPAPLPIPTLPIPTLPIP